MKRKKHSLFETSHLKSGIKKRSLRGGAVTLATQCFSIVINLGGTMILARILTPYDYGIMAMVAAITGFAYVFINLGLSTATIQRSEINHAQVSTLFWINTAIGAAVMLLVMGLAPAVAWFYQTPALLWVTIALSCNFLINGTAVQHQALLDRQMRFTTIAVIRIGSLLAGIVTAIIAAGNGFGYWALVMNSVAATVCGAAGVWLATGWRPHRPRRNTGAGPMLRYGADILGFNVINYFSRNLDNILIGRAHGSAALGFYSKAYQLMMIPVINLREPLNKVAMPTLSRLQNDPDQYRRYYMKFLSVLAFLSMPVVSYLYVCADDIIGLVLGPQWTQAVGIFKILAIAALIQPVSSTRGVVLVSTGKSRKYLWWGGAYAIITILSFIIGLPWGARGVAISYTVANYLVLHQSLVYVFKETPVRVRDFYSAVYKPLVASLAMGAACLFLKSCLEGFSGGIVLAACFALGAFIYLLASAVLPGGRNDINEYFSFGRLVFSNK
jgi:PST family polysaccharide transporter